MDNLKIQQQAGVIHTNLDVIEAEIRERMESYKDYLVTEDSVASDKKVLAELRKLQKELNDARISTKKQWLAPFDEFETRCNSIINLVTEPINLINTQIKMFDEERKVAKLDHIKELYSNNIKGLERFLPFEKVLKANPKWLNLSAKDQDILFDLSAITLKVKTDLDSIKALNSEIEEECIKAYADSDNNLAMAIKRNNQYIEDKKKVVQQEIKEAEISKKEKEEKKNPLEGTVLNDMVKLSKTVKIVISADDLQQVENILSFSDIKYEVIKE